MRPGDWVRVVLAAALTVVLFSAYWEEVAGVFSRAVAVEDCPVLIHPDGTWSGDGWTVAGSGTWCELNPNPQPGQPYLAWDGTWAWR